MKGKTQKAGSNAKVTPTASKPKKAKTQNNTNVSSEIGAYQVALTKPFHPAAYGARVPDLWSAPTTTSHIRKLVTINTNNSGNATGIIMPSLFSHAVLSEGSFTGNGVSDWTRWDGTSAASTLLYTEPGGIKAKISNARIVSYGVRFRNQASLSNVSGRFAAATMPIKDDMLGPHSGTVGGAFNTNASDTVERWYSSAGVPYTGTGTTAMIDASQIPSMPNNVSVSSLQMNEVGLDVVPKVITPYAFGLRNTADSYIGNDVGPGISTGAIYAGDDDWLKFGGFESIIFSASGLPANSAAMTLEIIYHVEGTPTLSQAGGLVPDAMGKTQVSLAAFHKALDFAAKSASFMAPVVTAALNGYKASMTNLPLL